MLLLILFFPKMATITMEMKKNRNEDMYSDDGFYIENGDNIFSSPGNVSYCHHLKSVVVHL